MNSFERNIEILKGYDIPYEVIDEESIKFKNERSGIIFTLMKMKWYDRCGLIVEYPNSKTITKYLAVCVYMYISSYNDELIIEISNSDSSSDIYIDTGIFAGDN